MIFLICGKAKSGKDTVSDYIVDKTGAKKFWFAESIKDFAMKYFGFTYDECYSKKTEHSRRALQAIGDMFRKEVGETFWINRVMLEMVSCDNEHFVMSDCRLFPEIVEFYRYFDIMKLNNIPNFLKHFEDYRDRYGELDYFIPNTNPCLSISVSRDDCPNIEYGVDHSTETELNNFPFDVYMENNGTIEELHKKINELLIVVGVLRE